MFSVALEVRSRGNLRPRGKDMTRRPLSVTIVAWLIIAFACFSLLASAASLAMQSRLEPDGWPTVPPLFSIVSDLISLVIGVGLLKGFNWARYLYVALVILALAVALVISVSAWMSGALPAGAIGFTGLALIPGLFVWAALIFFLFRAEANAFFRGEAGAAPKTPPPRTVQPPPPPQTRAAGMESQLTFPPAVLVIGAAVIIIGIIDIVHIATAPNWRVMGREAGERLLLAGIVSSAVLLMVAAGIVMREAWARYLFAGWTISRIIMEVFAIDPAKALVMIPYCIVSLVIVFLLFHPGASAALRTRRVPGAAPLLKREPLRERGLWIIIDILCVVYIVCCLAIWVKVGHEVAGTFQLLLREGGGDPVGVAIFVALMLFISVPGLAVGFVLAALAKGLPSMIRCLAVIPAAAGLLGALAHVALAIMVME